VSALSSRPGTIDVHAHCVPVGVIETLLAEGGRYGIELAEQNGRYAALIAGRVQTRDILPSLSDMPRRLAAMDAAGVDVQLLASWIDLTAYALDTATGVRYSRMFNEGLAATAAEAPDRFRALATVPLQAPKEAAEELRHAVTALGHVGVEIATTVDGRELDDPDLDPFWAAAEELRAVVVVHPYASLEGRDLKRYGLVNLIGNPAETTLALGHLIFGGVFERHPDLRMVLVHGGGFAPYQIGRWDRGFTTGARGATEHLTRAPGEWLQRLYFDTVLHSALSLRHLVDVVGAEHVVMGSDYPFVMGEPEPVRSLDAVPGLADGDRELILAGNLAGLLGDVGG
jgi:aminocarboxymuconate-semialdehyde decarboxylase